MTPEHKQSIELLIRAVSSNPRYDALILIGSLARGEEHDGSDVDVILIDSSMSLADGVIGVDENELGGPFPAQVSASCTSRAFLEEAAVRAPEPQRFAFLRAKVLFSRDESIENFVKQIAVYPEWEREEKMKSFYSQIPVHFSYLKLGESSRNTFLLTQTAEKLAFFCGRLILAHNRMLYPNRKQFMKALAQAPDKPEHFIETMERLLEKPSIANAEKLMDTVFRFRDWEVPEEGWMARFCRDSEQYWLFNKTVAPEDC